MAYHEKNIIKGFLAGEAAACTTISEWIGAILELGSWHHSIRAAKEDIKQEVLVSLLENFRHNKYKGLGLKSYVASVTKFSCLRVYDKSADAPIADFNIAADEDSPLEEIIRHESIEMIDHAFRKLDEKCRRILTLRFHNNLRHSNIAKLLEISVENSRQWLKRCVEKLKELALSENTI